jgi:hypothetical protein
LKLQTFASSRTGNNNAKNSSAFLKVATTTLLHTISESEKASYVTHINNYLAEDEFLKKYLPLDPSTNDLFEIAKDGVLLWYQSYIHYIILSSYVTNYDNFFIYIENKFHVLAVSLSMWQFRRLLMNAQSIQKDYLIHGKGMKITHYASILLKQLDVQLLTLALKT